MIIKKEIKIAIFFGGPGSEKEISKRGSSRLAASIKNHFNNIIMVHVDSNLNWKINNTTINNKNIFLKNDVDVAINWIHGKYGEDGVLQKIFEDNGIIYLGSDSRSLNKTFSKDSFVKICLENSIPTTKQLSITKNTTHELVNSFKILNCNKVIIKPSSDGSSSGISIATTIPILQSAVSQLLNDSNDRIVIEEFITGAEFSCGIYFDPYLMKNMFSEVIEIVYPSQDFFNKDAKYTLGLSNEIFPPNISNSIKRNIQDICLQAFNTCGLSDFARFDIILDKDNIPHILEVNTIPGFGAESIFSRKLYDKRIDPADFFHKLILYKLSLSKKVTE